MGTLSMFAPSLQTHILIFFFQNLWAVKKLLAFLFLALYYQFLNKNPSKSYYKFKNRTTILSNFQIWSFLNSFHFFQMRLWTARTRPTKVCRTSPQNSINGSSSLFKWRVQKHQIDGGFDRRGSLMFFLGNFLDFEYYH